MTGVVVRRLEIQLEGKGDHWFPVLAVTGPMPTGDPQVGGMKPGLFLIAKPTGKPAVEWIGLQNVTAVRHEPPPEGEAGVTWGVV
jgi:hypothetical protein